MRSPFDALFTVAAAPALAHHFGIVATLVRLLQRTENVRVAIRKRDYELVTAESAVPQIVSLFDFLVRASDYQFDGTVAEPRQGDRLFATINGNDHEFEATPVGRRPPAEPEDPSHERWVIHTNQVAQCPTTS